LKNGAPVRITGGEEADDEKIRGRKKGRPLARENIQRGKKRFTVQLVGKLREPRQPCHSGGAKRREAMVGFGLGDSQAYKKKLVRSGVSVAGIWLKRVQEEVLGSEVDEHGGEKKCLWAFLP